MNHSATIIFSKALDLSDETLDQFLLENCGEDGELRDEVQSLLAAHPKGTALFRDQAAVAEKLLTAPESSLDPAPRSGR